MINYNKEAKLIGLKYSIISFFNKNKFTIFLLLTLILLSLLTGVFTGIKLHNISGTINIEKYSFITLISGDIYSVSIFIKRFLSALLVMGICILFSTKKLLCLFGYILICYRAFLLALNCTFIIILLGFSGTINGILIILPCQLLILIVISAVFIISLNSFKNKEQCGKLNDSYFKSVLIGIILLFTINIIEAILLTTFKSTTLLII